MSNSENLMLSNINSVVIVSLCLSLCSVTDKNEIMVR